MQRSGDPNFDLILSDHPMVVPSPSPCPIGVVSVSATTAKGPFNPWPWLSEPRAELGSDSQPIHPRKSRWLSISCQTWQNSLVGDMLTRPGSCGRKSRACFQIWRKWKRPPRIYEIHPRVPFQLDTRLLSGMSVFRWVDLAPQGCRENPVHCTRQGWGRAEGLGPSRISQFNVPLVVPSLHS